MINNAFGLINTCEPTKTLKELVNERAVGAVPFGGRYRIIDFAMSNLVNSGITRVGVLTQKNYSSLMDHLGSGAPWDLDRKNGGLSILPPYVMDSNAGIYRGSIDALKAAMDFVFNVNEKYCVLMGAHTIFNMSFEKVIAQHVSSGADITYLYSIIDEDNDTIMRDHFEDVRITQNEAGRIVDMEINPFKPNSSKVLMDCLIIEKTMLEYLVDGASSRGHTDFLRDIVLRRLDTLKIHGYKFEGYIARISSVSSYFKANLDLLNTKISDELFDDENRIYTKVKDQVPTQYKASSMMIDVMVADGCIIQGDIENSIIFRGVSIARGAKIKNCIIMQGVQIFEGAYLENVIVDKNAIITRDKKLIGVESFPAIVSKSAIV